MTAALRPFSEKSCARSRHRLFLHGLRDFAMSTIFFAFFSYAHSFSACRDRYAANCSSDNVPSARACRIAQPGSLVCVQSRNRQWAARAVMAAKVSRIPSATSHTPNSRIPGVSMRNTPSTSMSCRFQAFRRVRAEIRLGQYHDRFRAAMEDSRSISCDPVDAVIRKKHEPSLRNTPFRASILWYRSIRLPYATCVIVYADIPPLSRGSEKKRNVGSIS